VDGALNGRAVFFGNGFNTQEAGREEKRREEKRRADLKVGQYKGRGNNDGGRATG